jgi:hypothetical protein
MSVMILHAIFDLWAGEVVGFALWLMWEMIWS